MGVGCPRVRVVRPGGPTNYAIAYERPSSHSSTGSEWCSLGVLPPCCDCPRCPESSTARLHESKQWCQVISARNSQLGRYEQLVAVLPQGRQRRHPRRRNRVLPESSCVRHECVKCMIVFHVASLGACPFRHRLGDDPASHPPDEGSSPLAPLRVPAQSCKLLCTASPAPSTALENVNPFPKATGLTCRLPLTVVHSRTAPGAKTDQVAVSLGVGLHGDQGGVGFGTASQKCTHREACVRMETRGNGALSHPLGHALVPRTISW